MNLGARLAVAAAVAVAAAWAGAQVYLSRFAAPASDAGVAVPAGRASMAENAGVESEFAAATQPSIKIPELLPDFTLADLNGKLTSISRWKGKSMMINFWATWCAPCRREIPLLQSLHQEKSGAGTEVLGIAVDYPDKVREFAGEFKVSYPLLVGEQDALDLAAALGVQSPAFPFTVFTDRRGQIVALYMGELKRPTADSILSVVADLNQDRIGLSAARAAIADRLAALGGKS